MANARTNLDRALKAVLRAVPRADYSACLTLIRSLIEGLPEGPLAAELASCVARRYSAEVLVELCPRDLGRWSAGAVAVALDAVRAMPRGKARARGLCLLVDRIELAEKREAFEAVLDGTLPTIEYQVVAVSTEGDLVRLLELSPASWGEEWLERKRAALGPQAGIDWEGRHRSRFGTWSAQAVERLWAESLKHQPRPGYSFPFPYVWGPLAPRLNADQVEFALSRIRACADDSARNCALLWFSAHLTDRECLDIVRYAREAVRRSHKRLEFDRGVVEVFGRVPRSEIHAFFEVAVAKGTAYERYSVLPLLLPFLDADDLQAAIERIAADSQSPENGNEICAVARFLTPSQVAKYLPRAGKGEPCLIRRALEFTPDERDGLLSSLLDTLGRKRPNRQVSRVSELLPWLNEISRGELPRDIAQWIESNAAILPSPPRRR
ncbi:MAG: hypothetical protein JST54_35860 [Deltaproteobacteria bacterium]|nr:hypothetical protein [Deltaproteobacteria bacterium]